MPVGTDVKSLQRDGTTTAVVHLYRITIFGPQTVLNAVEFSRNSNVVESLMSTLPRNLWLGVALV